MTPCYSQLEDEVSMIAQVELIGRSGCAHFWTLVTRIQVTKRPDGMPNLEEPQRIAYVCLLCRAVREAS
jgi:hypothetical protein